MKRGENPLTLNLVRELSENNTDTTGDKIISLFTQQQSQLKHWKNAWAYNVIMQMKKSSVFSKEIRKLENFQTNFLGEIIRFN